MLSLWKAILLNKLNPKDEREIANVLKEAIFYSRDEDVLFPYYKTRKYLKEILKKFMAELLKDKDNKEFFIVKDNSEVKARASVGAAESIITYSSDEYTNGVKVSVDDNTLDLLQGSTDDKFNQGNNRELRTSAFAVVTDDSPLYRRFNNVALGESATDACDSLAFVESVRGEYLMDEWNKNLQDKVVNYAGIWNKDKANGKLFFHIDTAWVNRGAGNIKPQYLISAAHVDVPGTPGVPCTYAHNHFDNAGNPVEADKCSHATPASQGFNYGKYLVSFGDSALIKGKEYKTPYMDIDGGYTRVGFVKAIHAGDSLFILVNDFANMKPEELNAETIIKAYEKAKAQEQAQSADVAQTSAPIVTPLEQKPATQTTVVDNADNAVVRQESVTVVSGPALKNFGVVVGSFSLKANAEGLQGTLKGAGYDPSIVYNSERNMYRVVAASFDGKVDAVKGRNTLRAMYADAWLLFNK
mgnify:CR=1 FL=1